MVSTTGRRLALGVVAAGLLLLATAELVLRRVVGLGDPPLYVADPVIEYLYAPSATYRRFGHTLSFNAYSMRSREFPREKPPGEYRVLVLGDSVVHGGAATDQGELATTLLERDLAARLGRAVTVGNVSAESWGPPNLLAYARRFGFFGADAVVIVVSSHDAWDVPTFGPLGPERPTERPAAALVELVTRYARRARSGERAAPAEPAGGDASVALAALCDLVTAARSAGATVLVALHRSVPELTGPPLPGHGMLRERARACGAGIVDLGPAFAAARAEGKEPYEDDLHPTPAGQRVLEGVLLEALSPRR